MTFVLDLYCPQATMTPQRIKLRQQSQMLVQQIQKLESRAERIRKSHHELSRLKPIHRNIEKVTATLCKMYEELFELHDAVGRALFHGKIETEEARHQLQTYKAVMDSIKRHYQIEQNRRHDVEASMKPIREFIWNEEEEEKLEQEFLEQTQPRVPRIPEDEPVPRIPEDESVPRIPEE